MGRLTFHCRGRSPTHSVASLRSNQDATRKRSVPTPAPTVREPPGPLASEPRTGQRRPGPRRPVEVDSRFRLARIVEGGTQLQSRDAGTSLTPTSSQTSSHNDDARRSPPSKYGEEIIIVAGTPQNRRAAKNHGCPDDRETDQHSSAATHTRLSPRQFNQLPRSQEFASIAARPLLTEVASVPATFTTDPDLPMSSTSWSSQPSRRVE
jgi:hypothetical protein